MPPTSQPSDRVQRAIICGALGWLPLGIIMLGLLPLGGGGGSLGGAVLWGVAFCGVGALMCRRAADQPSGWRRAAMVLNYGFFLLPVGFILLGIVLGTFSSLFPGCEGNGPLGGR